MSVRVLMMGALLLVCPLGVSAQSSSSLTDAAVAKQILDVEQAWAAAFQACQPDAVDKLTTADFTFTDYNGMTYSRHWFLTSAVTGCTRNVVRLEPMQVTINDNDNAAIVLSKYHQFVNDEPVPVHHLTHVLIREGDAWRVAHHHSTVMMSQAGPSGDQYGLPNSGKAFTQAVGGPSTRSGAAAPPPGVARYRGDPARNPKADRITLEKQALDAALTYANLFQNCRTSDLDKILSQGYLISGFNGMTYTRTWMLEGSDDCYHDIQRIEPLQLRLYGENTAILLGRYHQFVFQRATDIRHITVVAFREEGTWRVAFHHSTTFNEKLGSAEGKLFYSEGGDSTLVTLPFPNRVLPRQPAR